MLVCLKSKVTLRKSMTSEAAIQRCSENIQQNYRRTSMPKCDFNKVAKELSRNRSLHECSPVNLLHIFRTPFLKNASGRLLVKTSYNHICFLYFLFSVKRQKQPPELVYKKSCSEKFCKIHRKTLCRLLFLMKLKVLGLKFY